MSNDESNTPVDNTADSDDITIEKRRELLNIVTQETRLVLLHDIIAHPARLPTLKEINYMNPSKSKSTIRGHLNMLIEHGIVEKRTLQQEKRKRDLPWQFYGITDTGYDILDRAGLLRAEETLREIYERVDTTDEIEKYAKAPRP